MKNWKTTFTGTGAAVMYGLTILAGSSYELGKIAEVFNPDWKPFMFKVSLAAAIILHVINSHLQEDKKPAV